MFVGSWKRTETLSGTTSCLSSKTAGTNVTFRAFCSQRARARSQARRHLFCSDTPRRLDFIYDLFEHVGSRNGDETLKMGTARRKPTVSSQFRVRSGIPMVLISYRTFGSAASNRGISESIWLRAHSDKKELGG